ncbi:MAG: Tex family protein [Flavobacteriales bacterium]
MKEYQLIAGELAISQRQVEATVELLKEGATVPFIARYRKERTGGLEDVSIIAIKDQWSKLMDLKTRKEYILMTIEEQGKLTDELRKRIEECYEFSMLEDIYLPYKPKRKTKATVARELGLEPLAEWLMKEPAGEIEGYAERFVNDGVETAEKALSGARDIIAEWVNENEQARETVRYHFQRFGLFSSKSVKSKEAEGVKFKDYFDFSEPIQKCPSHRILALFRGEDEGFLRLSVGPDEEEVVDQLNRRLIKTRNAASEQIALAVKDSYKRLLEPSIETEFRAALKERADQEAIRVFAENLRQLLLTAPLGHKRILALDPGFRTGCKVVCLNEEGKLIHDTVIYPHEPQLELAKSRDVLVKLVKQFDIQCIAVGNGTAGRETESFVKGLSEIQGIEVYMVNESGASIYSASEVAREEFPDKDVTVRGAVSIGRRLADPLAELVKIDPKSIGVGQYQHDVDQNKLKESLDAVVLNCVNNVGVNVNTASKSLLTYVSGLGPQLAQNIVKYRDENGPFKSRKELKKVARLGEKAFEQCAGFLRIPNSKNILDNSAVHPESYELVERMAADLSTTVDSLVSDVKLRSKIDGKKYVSDKVGAYTIDDILKELDKPGRDPRGELKSFSFSSARKPEELITGSVVPGIVTNITAFGCFVDVGVKQEGLVHVSHLANRFVKDPNEVVKLGQHVMVKVMEVDLMRKRIGLSIKEAQ